MCQSTVLNLGIDNPRVVVVPATKKRLGKKMPQKRSRRAYLPSGRTAMNKMSDMFALAYAKRMSGHKDKKHKMNVITT